MSQEQNEDEIDIKLQAAMVEGNSITVYLINKQSIENFFKILCFSQEIKTLNIQTKADYSYLADQCDQFQETLALRSSQIIALNLDFIITQQIAKFLNIINVLTELQQITLRLASGYDILLQILQSQMTNVTCLSLELLEYSPAQEGYLQQLGEQMYIMSTSKKLAHVNLKGNEKSIYKIIQGYCQKYQKEQTNNKQQKSQLVSIKIEESTLNLELNLKYKTLSVYKSMKDYIHQQQFEDCNFIISCFRSDICTLKIQLGLLDAKLYQCNYNKQIDLLIKQCDLNLITQFSIEYELINCTPETAQPVFVNSVLKMNNLQQIRINCHSNSAGFYDQITMNLINIPQKSLQQLQLKLKCSNIEFVQSRQMLIISQFDYPIVHYLETIGKAFKNTKQLKITFNPQTILPNSPSNKVLFEQLYLLFLQLLHTEYIQLIFMNDFIYDKFFTVFKATSKLLYLKKIVIQTSRIMLCCDLDSQANQEKNDKIREQFLRQLMIFSIDMPDLQANIRQTTYNFKFHQYQKQIEQDRTGEIAQFLNHQLEINKFTFIQNVKYDQNMFNYDKLEKVDNGFTQEGENYIIQQIPTILQKFQIQSINVQINHPYQYPAQIVKQFYKLIILKLPILKKIIYKSESTNTEIARLIEINNLTLMKKQQFIKFIQAFKNQNVLTNVQQYKDILAFNKNFQ